MYKMTMICYHRKRKLAKLTHWLHPVSALKFPFQAGTLVFISVYLPLPVSTIRIARSEINQEANRAAQDLTQPKKPRHISEKLYSQRRVKWGLLLSLHLQDGDSLETRRIWRQKTFQLTLESFLKTFLRKTSTKTQENSNVSPVLCTQHLLSVLHIFPLIKLTKCEIKFNNIKALV